MITPLKYESCSVSCHHLMTTVRAWLFFFKVCNMLCQVSSSYENGQSMEIYHSCMKHAHAYDNGQSMEIYHSCMKHAHAYDNGQSMEINHSCMKHAHAYDNGQSMVIHFKGMKHAPSIVFVSWLWSEHISISLWYETCSISCLRLMKTVIAWQYIIHVGNMLRQLSSSQYIGQSMIIPP